MNFTPDEVLMEQIKAGNQEAFRRLFDFYRDKLFSYCCRITKQEATAEEIVQDVFMKIWTGRQQLNPSLSMNAYLYKITEHMALNFLKKLARDKKLQEGIAFCFEEKHTQTEDLVIYKDYEALLQEAIETMPPQRRRVFEMSRKGCLTHDEIALQLQISRHTVRNQIVAAIYTIRQYLLRHSMLRLPIIILLILSL